MTVVENGPAGANEPGTPPGLVPPGPRGNALFGMLRQVSRDRLGLMRSVADEYGDAVRFAMGHKALYFFNHPDHARHVLSDHHANYRKGIGLIHSRRALGDGLLTSEGELWRAQRRATQPVFRREQVTGATKVIAEEIEQMLARWRSRSGGTVDVVAEMTRLTLGVLGRALLHTSLGSFERIGHAFEAVQDQAMFEMVTLSTIPHWLPLRRQRRFRHARRQLEGMVDQLVAEHARRAESTGDDLMSRLIASADQEPDPTVRQRRIRDELVTLLLAGHETTASTLGWTWHLVSERPDVFERLHAEAVDVLGDRRPGSDDPSRLRYTGMVIEEAIRLYPPVWILPRRAVEEDQVGGFRVPAGADVMICPYTLHRHPNFWTNPDRFEPDRFAPDQAADRPRYAYIPFGAGPRFCIGNHLGMLEATLVVAMVAREFRLQQVSGKRAVPQPMLSLRVRGGLPMTVEPA